MERFRTIAENLVLVDNKPPNGYLFQRRSHMQRSKPILNLFVEFHIRVHVYFVRSRETRGGELSPLNNF